MISCNGKRNLVATPHYKRVIPASVAATIHDLLVGVVQNGTGQSAAISGVDVAGKTGTTSDYGDAWFVGWTPQITTAVWVGFPNKLVPMTTLFDGGPVEGGTFPAEIWRAFMVQALQISNQEKAEYGPQPQAPQLHLGRDRRPRARPRLTFGDTGTAGQATPTPSAPTGATTAPRHDRQQLGSAGRNGDDASRAVRPSGRRRHHPCPGRACAHSDAAGR